MKHQSYIMNNDEYIAKIVYFYSLLATGGKKSMLFVSNLQPNQHLVYRIRSSLSNHLTMNVLNWFKQASAFLAAEHTAFDYDSKMLSKKLWNM